MSKDENKTVGEVRLKNGSVERTSFVSATFISLKKLMRGMDSIKVLYDLVELCRNNTPVVPATEKFLKDRSLLDSSGNLHSSVKNVVLSAVEGEGLGIKLVNPAIDK